MVAFRSKQLGLGVLVAFVAVVSSASAAAPLTAWKLEQRSRVLGDQTLFVSPSGIKAVNRKDGLTILFAAPYSEVVTYSLRTRKICRQPFNRFENPYARAVAMLSGIAHGQVPLTLSRNYLKGGLQWSDFAIPEQYKASKQALFAKKEVTSSEPASGRLTGFRPQADRRAMDWLSRLYCVPKTGTVPYDCVFADVDNESHYLVKTYTMNATRAVVADFKAPSGLHAVCDPHAVMQDEMSNDAIQMMMGK